MKNKQLVSIIIRTKNERDWVGPCLRALKKQTYTNYEVVIVDDNSTDGTLDVVRSETEVCRVFHYKEKYYPGKALNFGCEQAKGDVLVFISAHCEPINDFWLEKMLVSLEDPIVAGVYGKQEPTEDSTQFDKRDLVLAFGLDRKVQWNEPFFHNANSAIKKRLWEDVRFDEKATNIEDRIWAANMQQRGYCVVYEPEARVYHHHGIHQNMDQERCHGVNKIISSLDSYIQIVDEPTKQVNKRPLIGMIPFSRCLDSDISIKVIFRLFDELVENMNASKALDSIYLLTDSEELIDYSESKYETEVIIPYLRKNDSHKTLLGVFKDFIDETQYNGSMLFAELTCYATKRSEYLRQLCKVYFNTACSSAAIISKNSSSFYKRSNNKYYRLDEEILNMKGGRKPFYQVSQELGMITHSNNILAGYFNSSDICLLEKPEFDISFRIRQNDILDNIKHFISLLE